MSKFALYLAAATVIVAGTVLVVSLSSGQQAEEDNMDTAGPEFAEVVFPPPAQFDHDFHIDDVELACVDCHHETEAMRLKTPHEEYFEDLWITCESCHHADTVAVDPRPCSDCHPRSPSGIKEQVISNKVATHLSCWECHDSGTGLEASENCSFCHYED